MDAIEFLERAGADASVFHGAQEARQRAIGPQLDPELASVLVAGDVEAVYRMLGQTVLIGLQVPAEEEEAPDEDDGDADERPPEIYR